MTKQIKSKNLYNYLVEVGAINGTEEEIQIAKKQYARLYRKVWNQKNNKQLRELRPKFSLEEYRILKEKAIETGQSPTSLIKSIALSHSQIRWIAPERDVLTKVLQSIAMATISPKYIYLLTEAEEQMVTYLKKH